LSLLFTIYWRLIFSTERIKVCISIKKVRVGISADSSMPEKVFEKADFIEIKKITEKEVSYFRTLTDKPIYFHVQYSATNGYFLPSAIDFNDYLDDFLPAYQSAHPTLISFHFGLASRLVSIDRAHFVAVAGSPPFTKEEITAAIEKNLRTLKSSFPESSVLVENLEFIPEAIAKGAYRYIQEADYFSSSVTRWKKMGILDGIVLDIAHALITAGNHPLYNGLAENPGGDNGDAFTDPVKTTSHYINILRENQESIDLIRCFQTYIRQMPLELIREIHISGIKRLSNGVFVDAHNEISETELEALALLLKTIQNNSVDPVPVTLEYSRDIQKIPELIDTLKQSCTAGLKNHQGV